MSSNPGRRAVLLAAMAGVLVSSGCRTYPGSAQSASPEPAITGSPSPTADTAPTLSALPELDATAKAAPPVRPTLEQTVSRFSGRVPSYWGLYAPNVLQTLSASGIGLTLDFCGGPGGSHVDGAVLDMLAKLELPATLFMNSRWIKANPALTVDLAAMPFLELANHGTGHLPLSVQGNSAYGIPGTRSVAAVYEEVMANDAILGEITGKRPRFFRPGTAFLDDIASEICHTLGVVPAGFSVNADGGATYPAAVVARETGLAKPGDIIICHGNQPGSGTAAGLAMAVPKLLDKGYVFTTLGAATP